MKVIKKSDNNVICCKCGAVLEYEDIDVQLSEVGSKLEAELYSFVVVCPNCGEVHKAARPATVQILQLGGGVVGSFEGIALKDLSKTFTEKGAKFFKVGDVRTITLSDGEEYKIQVWDNNEDELVIGFVDLIGTNETGGRCMNSNGSNKGSIEKTDMYEYLNGEFKNLLPKELVDQIDGLIFLPSEKEVFGKNEYADSSKEKNERQFEIFRDWHNRVKGYREGNYGRYWWLRSAYYGSANGFCGVITNGYAHISGAGYSNGFAPAFKIKKNKS